MIGVVAPEGRRRFVVEILDRVQLDEKRDERHQDQHQRRIAIGEDADRCDGGAIRRQPLPGESSDLPLGVAAPRTDGRSERPGSEQDRRVRRGPAALSER